MELFESLLEFLQRKKYDSPNNGKLGTVNIDIIVEGLEGIDRPLFLNSMRQQGYINYDASLYKFRGYSKATYDAEITDKGEEWYYSKKFDKILHEIREKNGGDFGCKPASNGQRFRPEWQVTVTNKMEEAPLDPYPQIWLPFKISSLHEAEVLCNKFAETSAGIPFPCIIQPRLSNRENLYLTVSMYCLPISNDEL